MRATGCGQTRCCHIPSEWVSGHGRSEMRFNWCSPDVAGLDFHGVYQAFRIHRQIYDLNWNPLRKLETGGRRGLCWRRDVDHQR
jgi:hypothetical protein